MRYSIKAISILMLLLIGATGVYGQSRITHKEYIAKYKKLAIEDQEIYGIPASITLAQGLLESDCGNSRLAVEANNHFGIKCKKDWTGETILHNDDAPNECFRKYPSVEESYRDHSEFLDKSTRYQALFELDIADYKGWAHGLKKAGYATNPKYAELLIKLINEHKLYLFDSGTNLAEDLWDEREEAENATMESDEQVVRVDVDNYTVALHSIEGYSVYINNGAEFVIAAEGDTYAKISKVARVPEKRIRKFNDVSKTTTLKAGEQVYIKAKGNRATNGKTIHLTKQGDTMHSISQQYGIKLKRLEKLNRIPASSTLGVDQQIRLM